MRRQRVDRGWLSPVFRVCFIAVFIGVWGIAQVAPASAELPRNHVGVDVLNLRAEPGMDAAVVARMSYGDPVTVLDGPNAGGWYPLAYEGARGWAWGGYLSLGGYPGWDGPAPDGGVDAALSGEKWIDVDRSSGLVTAYVGDTVVAQYWGLLGWDQSEDGFYATATGTFFIHAREADLTWTRWANAYITHYMEFDGERHNGFHSWSLDAEGAVIPGGAGPTGGCVSLAPADAAALYAFAEIGTRVEVHW